jgi:hypothetical protein
MSAPSLAPRLTDILEAIEHIRSEMADVTIDAFEAIGASVGWWSAGSKLSRRPVVV